MAQGERFRVAMLIWTATLCVGGLAAPARAWLPGGEHGVIVLRFGADDERHLSGLSFFGGHGSMLWPDGAVCNRDTHLRLDAVDPPAVAVYACDPFTAPRPEWLLPTTVPAGRGADLGDFFQVGGQGGQLGEIVRLGPPSRWATVFGADAVVPLLADGRDPLPDFELRRDRPWPLDPWSAELPRGGDHAEVADGHWYAVRIAEGAGRPIIVQAVFEVLQHVPGESVKLRWRRLMPRAPADPVTNLDPFAGRESWLGELDANDPRLRSLTFVADNARGLQPGDPSTLVQDGGVYTLGLDHLYFGASGTWGCGENPPVPIPPTRLAPSREGEGRIVDVTAALYDAARLEMHREHDLFAGIAWEDDLSSPVRTERLHAFGRRLDEPPFDPQGARVEPGHLYVVRSFGRDPAAERPADGSRPPLRAHDALIRVEHFDTAGRVVIRGVALDDLRP